MHTFRKGPETWKRIAVGQRKWANLNPAATTYDRSMTFEDYYNTRWIVDPFRLFDTCLNTDGGRAMIITSTERARDLRHPPVLIMGVGQHNPSYDVHQATYLAGPTGAKKAGEMALNMARITLNDIDSCEIYDCFTYTVEITLQTMDSSDPVRGRIGSKTGPLSLAEGCPLTPLEGSSPRPITWALRLYQKQPCS